MARVSRNIGNGRLEVRRTLAFSDSIPLLTSPFVGSDKPRGVGFEGENGVDAGGLTREWFSMVGQLVAGSCDNDPAGGLFVREQEKSYLVVDKHRFQTEQDLKAWYGFGRLLALAILKNELISIELPVFFYARFMKERVELQDMRPELEEAAKNLENILKMTPDKFGKYGAVIDFDELPEDEAGTTITFANKESVVARILAKYGSGDDEPAFEQMRAGFSELLDLRRISERISPVDFRRLISGDDILDVARLKALAELSAEASQESFDWLFEWLDDSTIETKRKFMKFVTGSPSFSPRRIVFHGPGFGQGKLPIGHTCFNTIDLPRYNTKADLVDAMELAVASEEFGRA